jgi:hypothetical protein
VQAMTDYEVARVGLVRASIVDALSTLTAVIRDMPDEQLLRVEKDLGRCIDVLQLKTAPV